MLCRVTSQNVYNSGITTFSYNVNGYNNASVTNALNQTKMQTLNAQGQLYQLVDSLGKTIGYSYTPFGNLQQITDSLNNKTYLYYDIRGRRTQVNDPDMGIWNYTYNAFGDLVSQTDAKNNLIQMTYDINSRVLTKAAGGQTYTWTYDTAANGKGKPANVTGPGYQEAYTYDSLSRPQDVNTTLDGTTYTVTTSYDAYSRVSGITYPSTGSSRVSVGYQYTSNGYLQNVRDLTSGTVYWTANTRNALAQVTEEALGNGLVTDKTFDPATGRLTAITTSNNVQSLSYTYDSLSNLLSRKDNLKTLTESFTYDPAANRLTTATVTGSPAKNYSYNVIGNILTKSDVGTYTYGSSRPHAVTSAGGVNYTYDANGNVTSDSSGRSIGFDGFNRPTQLTNTGANGTLVYDAYDALVKQVLTQGSTTTTTIYLGDLFEKVTTGSVTEYKNYILAEGEQVAISYYRNDGTNNTYYLHKDHLGSTDVTTNALGNVVDSLSYDPFGMRRNASNWKDQAGITCNTTDYGYTGHIQLDTFSLIHMGARIYDPKLGRFISPDNVVQNVANSQALNRYSYCTNNPLRYIDPTGNLLIPMTDSDLGNVTGAPGIDGFGYIPGPITWLDPRSLVPPGTGGNTASSGNGGNDQGEGSTGVTYGIPTDFDIGHTVNTNPTTNYPPTLTYNPATDEVPGYLAGGWINTNESPNVNSTPLLAAANTGIANDAAPPVYSGSANNPGLSPVGVYIDINRTEVQGKVVFGTIDVSCPSTGESFSGYTMSTLMGKPILEEGVYSAYVNSNHDPARIQIYDSELSGQPWSGIQIHVGNIPDDSKGCYIVGYGHGANNEVTNSRNAMIAINSIINNDGTGRIIVRVHDYIHGL